MSSKQQKYHPGSYPRRILLCTVGLSPQILTETIYALAVKNDFIPTEAHLITTAEGKERARLDLLSENPGWFRRLCQDYQLPDIAFDEDHIHVLSDPLSEDKRLSDPRSAQENERAADEIIATVRQFTQDDNAALHVSIAGGRKTMGFFVGYALSLYGRQQDRLSHILADPKYENHREFYYPTPYSRIIHTPPPDNRPLDTRAAEVVLASIPFVRLRDGLPKSLLEGTASFSEVVSQAQRSLEAPQLILDSQRRQISCSGIEVPLKPVDFALYAWFARRALTDKPGIRRNQVSKPEVEEFLAEYRTVVSEFSGEYERVEQAVFRALDNERFHKYFDDRKAPLHRVLNETLGEAVAKHYYIISEGRDSDEGYALRLTSEQIIFKEKD